MTHHAGEEPTRSSRQRLTMALWALLPVAVAVALFAFGRTHTPTYTANFLGLQVEDVSELKAQLGSALFGLALVQLLLGLWMYGRLPAAGSAPRPVPTTHRLTGLAAFLLSLPIAYHCITAYGVQLADPRVALHSVTGCALYGAFITKVLVVRARRLPGWALPAAGGALVVAIALMWYSAALWYLNGNTAPGL
jgi:hypothetical protein